MRGCILEAEPPGLGITGGGGGRRVWGKCEVNDGS